MVLLDIIVEPHRVPDTIPVPKPIIHDTVPVSSDTVDTVVYNVNTLSGSQQLADAAPIPPEALTGDDCSTLLWSIVVVLAALCLCFYFVRNYRKARN
ncbi:MAG: hypothetical protein IJT53_04890 [Prevotella sp.]|nr:hypothetical protein [Prevotella sp.]